MAIIVIRIILSITCFVTIEYYTLYFKRKKLKIYYIHN